MASRLWTRWRRFAHRAAEIQAMVVLAGLYWVVVVPAGTIVRRRRVDSRAPAWKMRQPAPGPNLDDARRQF
ncbi:MAG TPA: hypothetical protein VEL51_17325 [Vicinamibacterales bacterium]|nr:hypothetical protein [Vicinamibacterales bacterium]